MTSQKLRRGPTSLCTIWKLPRKQMQIQKGGGNKKHVGCISQGSLYLWHTHDKEHNR